MEQPKDKYLLAVYNDLNTRLEKQSEALPKDLNKQRFVQNCMTVLTENDFSKCDPTSVARTLMKGAYLGLDFFAGECYAINYGGKVQFQTDYKGQIKLCKKYSSNPIKDLYARIVREGDEFEEVIVNGQQSVNFRPKAFNDGEILGAFAVCLYKDGSMIYDAMSKQEIENTRKNFSKMSSGPAWTKSYSEMCKKTVLRRLCKLIDINFDFSEQYQAYEDGSDFDVKGTEKPEVEKGVNPFENGSSGVIDVAPEEVVDVMSEAKEVFPE